MRCNRTCPSPLGRSPPRWCERKRQALPAEEYRRRERERVLRGDFDPPTVRMYHAVLGFSKAFRDAFVEFWDLPEDWELPEREAPGEDVA